MRKKTETFVLKNWHIITLALIALFSFWLYFYNIGSIGYGNAYYAAAIKSMTLNAKNFFFVSFDPAGLVSVDKPPLGLWVQVLFVRMFGYSGWAMLLPQALAGTGSVILMYVLTQKYFGRPAGLIAALVFALTPAVAVASRNNTMDMQLVFVLLAAAWFLFKSIETSRWRWLFVCAVLIGVGFNIKMLQAYMILPAVAAAYLLFSRQKLARRIAAAGISFAIMLAVSLAWVVVVDLTPASQRPYVGSSTNNSELELAIGHNGAERILGQGALASLRLQISGGTGSTQQGQGKQSSGTNNASKQQFLFQFPQNGQSQNNASTNLQKVDPNTFMRQRLFGANGLPGSLQGLMTGLGGGGGNDIDNKGPFRLWVSSLYGQASWLLVLAFFCIAVRAGRFDRKNPQPRQAAFVFWIGWVAAMFAFFSFADFWHRYYLCMLAPGIAGLVGPGIVDLFRAFRKKSGWKQYLLPASVMAALAFEAAYVFRYADLRVWLFPLMIACGALAVLLMLFWYQKPRKRMLRAAACLMLVSLLAAPLYWSITVMLYPAQNSTMPYAGPELASKTPVLGMTPNQENLTAGDKGTLSLEKYLVAHYREGTYLVVSQKADDVAQYIVDTGLPAVAFGGFNGTDKAMTLDGLKRLVQDGKVTYFWIPGSGTSSELNDYVKKNAVLVDPQEYLEDGLTVGQSGGKLYLF